MAKKKLGADGKPADPEKDRALGEAERWKTEIRLYEREADKFTERGKKIIRRFKDERNKGPEEHRNKFNILWSNVQTLTPALFAKNPVVNVERRFQSDDDAGRFASEVLERGTGYFVDDKFYDCVKECVLDRLLPGRGTAWVRYLPKFADQAKLPEITDAEPEAELLSEEVVVDYVHWQDFGHTYGRTWEEVDAVWRRVFMDREALIKRFGETIGKEVQLDYAPEKLNDEKLAGEVKKATVYEIWSKRKKYACWIHKDYPTPLDEKEDPLKLKEFFPCPRPLFATQANDTVIPVADYTEYQDQADELDQLTARISLLTQAVRVAGVYAGDAEGVQRLLAEGMENRIIPIDNWAMFAEKGGLKGVIDYLPLVDIVSAIGALYEARERVKHDLYEISGISDILRGEGDPNETATGVRTKGQFGTMRLTAMQSEVARFNRDLVRIMAEIISTHFSDETLKAISGVQLLTEQEKQQLQAQIQMAQQSGQQMPPPSEKMQEAMSNPTWEEVLGLLKNDLMRAFRIDIEIDSTIKMDQDKERQGRIDFLTAAGGFLQQAATVQSPVLQPVLYEMLMFGIRGFHVGKELESTFKVAQKKIEQEAQNPTQKPDPEMAKVQLEHMKAQQQQQNTQGEIALEQAKAQKNAELEQAKMQADEQIEFIKFSHQRDLEQKKLQHEGLKLSLEREIEYAKLMSQEKTAHFAAKTSQPGANHDEIATEMEMGQNAGQPSKLDTLQQGQEATLGAIAKQQQTMEQQMTALLQIAQAVQQAVAGIQETKAAIKAPKKVVRDKKGRVESVVVE